MALPWKHHTGNIFRDSYILNWMYKMIDFFVLARLLVSRESTAVSLSLSFLQTELKSLKTSRASLRDWLLQADFYLV